MIIKRKGSCLLAWWRWRLPRRCNWRLVMTGAMTTGIITTTISLLSGTIMIFITIMTMQVLP